MADNETPIYDATIDNETVNYEASADSQTVDYEVATDSEFVDSDATTDNESVDYEPPTDNELVDSDATTDTETARYEASSDSGSEDYEVPSNYGMSDNKRACSEKYFLGSSLNELHTWRYFALNSISDEIMSTIASKPDIDAKCVEEKLLLKLHENNRGDALKLSGIHGACILNNFELVKFFVEHGCDVNVQSEYKYTPLHILFHHKVFDTNIMDYLLNLGADVRIKDSNFETPFLIATEHCHLYAVRRMLQYPCDVNASDVKGETPLMRASGAGSLELVDLLLANGADTNILQEGTTLAIHFAILSREAAVFKRLLETTDFRIISLCEGVSSLARLIVLHNLYDFLQVVLESSYWNALLERTFPINKYSEGLCTLLCSRYKTMSVVGYMLFKENFTESCEHMFDRIIGKHLLANSVSQECIPPLSVALIMPDVPCRERIIEKLVHHGADVNHSDPAAPEALLCAFGKSNYDTLLFLFQHSNFATPESVLNVFTEQDVFAYISTEVAELFFKLGMTSAGVKLLSTCQAEEDILDSEALFENVYTLQKLSRIAVRHMFLQKWKNMSINEILKTLNLPTVICGYLRYEIV